MQHAAPSRLRNAFAALAAGLLFAACSASGSTAPDCETAVDCARGQTCLEGACVEGAIDTGSVPPGLARPNSRSAAAWPVSCPMYQPSIMASAFSARAISTMRLAMSGRAMLVPKKYCPS